MKETHLIVLWNKARKAEKELLAEMGRRFGIRRAYEICWSERLVARNFRRFYGTRLPGVERKVDECGTGPFLAVVVEVADPAYGTVITSRGHESAITQVFAFKDEIRRRRGLPVHATNSPEEFAHDLLLLTGITAEAFEKSAPGGWDGRIVRLERDVLGEGGWKDAAEMLAALRTGPRHVVLRGIEEDGSIEVNRSRDDVDILTDAAEDVRWLLGGDFYIGRFSYRGYGFYSPVRGKLAVKIGGEETLFDIYDVRQRYYDSLWEEQMLSSRVFRGGAYRLDDENARFESLYHRFFHKVTEVPGGDGTLTSLLGFLSEKGYSARRPLDTTIRFNEYLLDVPLVKRRIESRFGFSGVRQIQFEQSAKRGGSLYFSAEGPKGMTFVKVARNGFGQELPALEFRTMEKVSSEDPRRIVRPFCYSNLPELKAVGMEFVDGRSLEDVMKDADCMSANGDRLAEDLLAILEAMHRAGVVHRDIRPANFIVDGEGRLRLFDFQFAVFPDRYSEFPDYLAHPEWIRTLGDVFAPGDYRWDDAYSVARILLLFPQTDEVRRIRNACEGRIGKLTVRFPRSRLRKYALRLKLAGLIPFPSLRRRVRDSIRGIGGASVR